jgi:very-short-patch-repair endonuclease
MPTGNPGQSRPLEWGRKISEALTGHTHSEETRRKISEAAKRQHAEGRVSPKWDRTGVPHSEETRAKMREGARRFRESMSEEAYREHIVQRNTKAFKWKKPSGLELQVASMLRAMGVEFVAQHPIFKYTVDFYVPSENLVIEVNGCWWHRCKECGHKDDIRARFRDARRVRSLESRGYEVIVLWEHDLSFD